LKNFILGLLGEIVSPIGNPKRHERKSLSNCEQPSNVLVLANFRA